MRKAFGGDLELTGPENRPAHTVLDGTAGTINVSGGSYCSRSTPGRRNVAKPHFGTLERYSITKQSSNAALIFQIDFSEGYSGSGAWNQCLS